MPCRLAAASPPRARAALVPSSPSWSAGSPQLGQSFQPQPESEREIHATPACSGRSVAWRHQCPEPGDGHADACQMRTQVLGMFSCIAK